MIPGSDDVAMRTSTAQYKNEDISFRTVSTDYLSTLITIELNDGSLSFDVKGYAWMSNEKIVLLEGGSLIFNINCPLIFNINGLKNVTGGELTRMFSSVAEDEKSIDLDGRKMSRPVAGWHFQATSSHAPPPTSPPPPSNPCQLCGDYSVEHKAFQGWPVSLDDHQCCHGGFYVPHSMLGGLGGCAEIV